MKSKEHLFSLIHSLTRGEQRSFALHMKGYQTQGKKVSSILYDAIRKQSIFDEEQLKKKLGLNDSKLASQKHELLQLLLAFLMDYYKSSGIAMEINTLLTQARVLILKNQFSLAEKLLKKALKLARKSEDFSILPQINLYLNRIYFDHWFAEKHKDLFDHFEQSILDVQHLSSEIEYREMFCKLYLVFLENSGNENKQTLEKLHQITNNPLFKDEAKAVTFLSKYFLFFSKRIHSVLMNDSESDFLYLKKMKANFQKHPEVIPAHFAPFLSTEFNYIGLLSGLGRFQEVKTELEKLKTFPQKYKPYFNERMKAMFHSLYYSYANNSLIYTYQYKEMHALLEEEKKLIKKNSWIEKNIIWEHYLNSCTCEFFLRNFDTCSQYVYEMEGELDISFRPSYYFVMKMAAVLSQYELENEAACDSNFNALYFYSRKNALDHSFYKTALKLLRKLSKNSSIEDPDFLKEVKSELTLTQSNEKQIGERILDIWLESKILNVSLNQIIEKRGEPFLGTE